MKTTFVFHLIMVEVISQWLLPLHLSNASGNLHLEWISEESTPTTTGNSAFPPNGRRSLIPLWKFCKCSKAKTWTPTPLHPCTRAAMHPCSHPGDVTRRLLLDLCLFQTCLAVSASAMLPPKLLKVLLIVTVGGAREPTVWRLNQPHSPHRRAPVHTRA